MTNVPDQSTGPDYGQWAGDEDPVVFTRRVRQQMTGRKDVEAFHRELADRLHAKATAKLQELDGQLTPEQYADADHHLNPAKREDADCQPQKPRYLKDVAAACVAMGLHILDLI